MRYKKYLTFERDEIPDRPPFPEIYIRLAEIISLRSTCSRKSVGIVLTDLDLEQILSVGYNGNAREFPNRCDRIEAGNCGCIHAEENALVKANGREPKIAFLTLSPCEKCAKLLVQANVKAVFYREKYRLKSGLFVLDKAGIERRLYNHLEGVDFSL